MKLPMVIVGILVGAVLGTVGLVIYPLLGLLPPLLGICIGACVGGIAGIFTSKGLVIEEQSFRYLPKSTVEFITLVIKKMRYRKKVRADVQAELAAHFEDELQNCKTDDEKEQKAKQLIEQFGDVKLLAVLLHRAKKRCRPLWRTVVARTFQTIGVLILCLIVYCVYISLGKPTIAVNYVKETTRLTRPVADESLNAAPIYQKAIDAYKKPPLVEDETETREISLLDAIARRDKDWVTELTEEELALLKQWLSDNADASEFFKQASEKPHCWWKREAEDNLVLNVLLPELSPLRNIAKMMVWQAKLKAYDGHTEEAFDDLLTCYRAGRHFKGPRLLIEQLVGIAIQALSTQNVLVILNNQDVDSQLLRNLQIRLEELMAEDTYIINYEVERFCVLDFIQRCYTNNGRGSGHMIPSQIQEFMHAAGEFLPSAFLPSLAASIASANRGEISREFEKFYSAFEERATKTPWQLHEEKGCGVDFEMDLNNWSTLKKARYWPVSLLMPALGAVSKVSYRNKTQVEAVITTIAIIRFKQSTGDYPENLKELVTTGYLKKIPLDPFSDKPLVYKKTDDNFILYSVGLNFKDDGGQVYRDEKGKPQLWHDEFGDAVFWPVQKSEVKQ
jgi:uncharacterized membrane protein